MSKPWGRLRKFLWPSQKSWTLFINLEHAAKQCSLCNLCSLIVQWLIMVVNFLAKVSRRNQLISMASLSFSRLVRSEGCSQLILKLRHAKQGTKGWNYFCKKILICMYLPAFLRYFHIRTEMAKILISSRELCAAMMNWVWQWVELVVY